MAISAVFDRPAIAELEPRTASFDAVYAATFRKVFRWVRAHGCPEADVEDLTQEVFVIVQRKLASFDGAHLHAWLYQITKRTVRDHRRSAWFRNLFSRPSPVDVDELDGSTRGATELLAAREARETMAEIVAQMKPAWRGAFVLFEIDGVSGEEIAELEGISLPALWTRLHRARKEFEQLVAARVRKEVV